VERKHVEGSLFRRGSEVGNADGQYRTRRRMYRDGFNDPLSGLVMGETAENLARKYEISREEQDRFALRSQQKAEAAANSGRFDEEIAPLEIKGRKAKFQFLTVTNIFGLELHRSVEEIGTCFFQDRTVTAGNSSGITDGAAALVVLSEKMVEETVRHRKRESWIMKSPVFRLK